MRLSLTKAFTLLEVVFVIVILGVVASIGSSVIVQTFDSYIMQRSVHDASIKTELVINQLANRLTYRMDLSLLARKPGKIGTVEGTDFYPARNVPLSKREEFRALEWISYDSDSFEAYLVPRWSGYCDLNSSKTTFSKIDSVGSNHTEMKNIITHYTGTSNGTGGALRFLTASYGPEAYSTACLYGGSGNRGCMFPVNLSKKRFFTFPPNNDGNRTVGQMVYSEFYQYATSAFAVVPEAKAAPKDKINGLKVYDLKFYYGYQPWQDENYEDGRSATLLENVSVFRFRKEENSIRLKICVIERISDTDQISICKEKAVIR